MEKQEWRAWTARALAAYAVALGAAAAAAVPVVLSGISGLTSGQSVGGTTLHLVLYALASGLLAMLGVRAIRLGRALAKGTPSPKPLRRVVEALAALVAAMALMKIVAGDDVLLGLVGLAAGLFGFMATGAWSSRAPGSAARAVLLGILASILYFGAAVARGTAYVPPTDASAAVQAMLQAMLPPSAGLVVASFGLLAWAAMYRTENRILGPALVGVAGVVAGAQLLVHGVDFVALDWPNLETAPTTMVAALVLSLMSVLVAVMAGALGILASGFVVARHAPVLIARLGAGFMAPEAGAACTRCGLLPPYHAKFCPDCGEALGSVGAGGP